MRAEAYSHDNTCNDVTGVVTTSIYCDFGEVQDLEHGLISGGWMKETWSIHPDDPTSAFVKTEWEENGGREGQMWRTRVSAGMHADKDDFFLTARLEAYENDVLEFERDYTDKISRDMM